MVVVAAAISFVLSAAGASPVGAQTGGYSDVHSDAYYSKPVVDLALLGVFSGTECAQGFCPNESIDRKTAAVWMVRVLDGNDPDTASETRFADVDAASFYAPFIERMFQLGVTQGCSDGSQFCPDRNVTRAQMAAFLSHAYQLPEGPRLSFSDVPKDAWYAQDVARIAASGITTGCHDGSQFCPNEYTTRGQMATFLHRALAAKKNAPPGADDVLGFGQDVAIGLQRDTTEIDIMVYYCGEAGGPNDYSMSDLVDVTAWIQSQVDGLDQFYRSQSSNRSTIDFTIGGFLRPDIDWNSPDTNLNHWVDRVYSYWTGTNRDPNWYADPCGKEIHHYRNRNKALILADVDTNGTAGYAYNYGQAPAVVAVPERLNNSREFFLYTVAHEIGHAFYGLSHPWVSKGLKDRFDLYLLAQRNGVSSEEAHLASSIMSYVDIGAKKNLARDRNDSAYVACYQRQQLEWADQETDHRNCRSLPSLPQPPTRVTLTPGDGSIDVSWSPPPETDDVIDYHIRYYEVGGNSGWMPWKPSNINIATRARIETLTNGTTYRVQIAAENRIGIGVYSDIVSAVPIAGEPIPERIVTLTVGARAQGELGADGICKSVHCRWLHIDISGFPTGEYTLACAHNGVDDKGYSRGVYDSDDVSDWPATDRCLFGFPGSEVFVIVGAERRGDTWFGGIYSDTIVWPSGDTGSDQDVASSVRLEIGDRTTCSDGSTCYWMQVSHSGLGPGPWEVKCATRGYRLGSDDPDNPEVWRVYATTHNPTNGCRFGRPGNTVYVIVNGVKSNDVYWNPPS